VALLNKGTAKLKSRDIRFAKLYAKMLINGDINWEMLGRVYRPDDKHPSWKAKRVVRSKEIQNLTTEAINEIYSKQGIDSDLIVKEEVEMLTATKEKGDYTNALKIIANWRESLDLKPQKVTVTQQIEGDMSHLLPDNTTGKLKAKQKQVTEGSIAPIDGDGDED